MRHPAAVDLSALEELRIDIRGLDFWRASASQGLRPATPPAKSPDDVLTVPETAALLRLPEGTVYRMLTRGEIKGTLFARRWRVRRSDIVALFDGAPAAPTAPPFALVTSAPRVGRPGRPRRA